MEYFLQGIDFQIWSIVEEDDLIVLNNRDNWTEDDRKKISLNCKVKNILCCALSEKEFNGVSACKSAMEIWEKLRITYEGTDKVEETRIDNLVTQYERFQMQSGETITQMFNRFTDITNRLAGLGKSYEMGDIVRKILRSLPSSWTPKVTAIEEANDLKRMSLEKLIGSLMAYEINMERLGESPGRKKHSNALKAEEDESEEGSYSQESMNRSEDEEAMLSRRLQRIVAKKKISPKEDTSRKGKTSNGLKSKIQRKMSQFVMNARSLDTSRQSVQSSRNLSSERRTVQEILEDTKRRLWQQHGITTATLTVTQAQVKKKKKPTWHSWPTTKTR
ncbi:hypothetical protein Taro_006768 [Colocasia esculenta]|uniref:UBN2 domain-containing protein n=1 Tax=Colocasia esculenta TaxID=4460 RepID=A0A843TX09_COLES|nr:hypothetical protein [Colocasia esculenta]